MKITQEVAEYQLRIAENRVNQLIDMGIQQDEAYALVAENMALNDEEFGRVAADVAEKYSINMDKAASSGAQSMSINSENIQTSLNNIVRKTYDVAKSIAGMMTGGPLGSTGIYGGGGSTSKGGIIAKVTKGNFKKASVDPVKVSADLESFKSQLEVDIKGYTDAISNINSQIEVLRGLQATFHNTANSANGGIGGHNYANKIKDLEKEKDKINNALNDAKSGGGSTDDAKDEFEELIDFFEQRANVLNDILSFLKTGMDNVIGSFAKNQLVDAELDVTEEKFRNYTDALAMYTGKANEALSVIPADIAQKVKEGAVDLTTFIGEGNEAVVEAIRNYEQWADKVTDCTQQLEELKTAIRQLELEKFNNIMDDFTDQFNLHKDGKDLISKQIDLLKEAGELIGESFYNEQIDQSRKQLELLEEEKTQLVEQLADALSSGRVNTTALLHSNVV